MSAVGATSAPIAADVHGVLVEFAPVIETVAHRYFATDQPLGAVDEQLARKWHAHDTAYLLQWAVDDAAGYGSLDDELRWLVDVLHHRNFPLDGLAVNLDIVADVIATNFGRLDGLVDSLRDGARLVRQLADQLGASVDRNGSSSRLE